MFQVRKSIVVVLLSAVLLLSVSAFAIEDKADKEVTVQKSPNTIEIGGKKYTRGQIIADFLRVAFSDRVWNDDLEPRSKLEWILNSPRKIQFNKSGDVNQKSLHPWLDEYLGASRGIPKSGVINKWNNQITIGIDWPSYGWSAGKRSTIDISGQKITTINRKSMFSANDAGNYYNLYSDIILSLIPQLEEATAQSIKFIKPDDTLDSTKDHAHIRVIPALGSSRKFSPVGGMTPFKSNPLDFQRELVGGVLFGSSVPFQTLPLDGYLLPDHNNNLGLVICSVDPKSDLKVIKSSIAECLVRALGLPEISSRDGAGVLKTWFHGTQPSESQSLSPTPYDLYMVSLLYCSDIRSGMSKNEVIDVLREQNKCIKTGE